MKFQAPTDMEFHQRETTRSRESRRMHNIAEMEVVTYISFLLCFWLLIAYISRAVHNDIEKHDQVFNPYERIVKTDKSENIFWFVQVCNYD